ncbi:MAG: hypothetical protein PHT51_05020 [Patescibacteria group bacterium]|nr:hypothetical protein [Patescibacteria group bacterium]MDD4610710.1 hypothetical protein [Patescibacteria group bacterium]
MNKTPQFIEVKDAGARIGSDYIAITKNGTFSIYAGFYREKNIKSFSRAIFLIDKAQNLIAIQFGNEELGKGAYAINHGEKTASINANNIFSNYEIDVKQWYGRYTPEKYEIAGRPNVYMIDLDDKMPIVRKPHKKQTNN